MLPTKATSPSALVSFASPHAQAPIALALRLPTYIYTHNNTSTSTQATSKPQPFCSFTPDQQSNSPTPHAQNAIFPLITSNSRCTPTRPIHKPRTAFPPSLPNPRLLLTRSAIDSSLSPAFSSEDRQKGSSHSAGAMALSCHCSCFSFCRAGAGA